MPESIDRDRVAALTASGAQLVEVLPTPEFDEEHLPDAMSVPLTSLDAASVGVLDRGRPVIVYCWDAL